MFWKKKLRASIFFTIVDEFWWFSMQKTADGLKKSIQKSVFWNVSWIWRVPSTDIVFFQKQEKVFVRVPNDLKCYENRDLTCLNHRLVPQCSKKTAGEREREREWIHVCIQRTTKHWLSQLMFLQNNAERERCSTKFNFHFFTNFLDVSTRADFDWKHFFYINATLFFKAK